MSGFIASPDYQFNLAEGQNAVDRSAAARSGLLSGRAVKEGQRVATGIASREYGSYVQRLMQQAGLGAQGVSTSAGAGLTTAANIGDASMAAGNARASSYLGAGESVNNAVQGGVANLLLSKYLRTPSVGDLEPITIGGVAANGGYRY